MLFHVHSGEKDSIYLLKRVALLLFEIRILNIPADTVTDQFTLIIHTYRFNMAPDVPACVTIDEPHAVAF